MLGGLSHERNVRLAVRPSVYQKHALWKKRKKSVLISYTAWKTIGPSYLARRMVSRERLLLPKILDQTDPVNIRS